VGTVDHHGPFSGVVNVMGSWLLSVPQCHLWNDGRDARGTSKIRIRRRETRMKIVVVGGTGRLGSQVVAELQRRGHKAVAAAPSTGFDTITGAGVAEGLTGAQVVVDVSNSPSFEDMAALQFFQTSTRTLLAAEREAGVAHHVVLSIVGADRAPDSGYMRAKVAQEQLVAGGGVPYTIVRATQFFEFLGAIADSATTDGTVRLPSGHLQPIAAGDLAVAVADVVEGSPTNAVVDVAGPEALGLDDLVRRVLSSRGDPRPVITDDSVTYYGAHLDNVSLIPGPDARIASTRLDDWLNQR
jgi:uncharacterized protein YbjT (DUF2867 family)